MAAFRDRIGTGRKLAIQILEFLIPRGSGGPSVSTLPPAAWTTPRA
ncbi:SelB C-terminal domain-containing protein [Halomonas sp. TA6]